MTSGGSALGWSVGIPVIGLLLLTWIALISYHSGWSRFQRRIDVMQARLEQVGRYSRHARQEAARLRSVHRQAVDWMVLLSKAIHRPWHVPAAWMDRQSYEVARGALPFAVQIATIQDDDRAATERMRAAMTDQLIVRGWRHSAFESLVAELALLRGTQSGSFGIDALDEDLPHSSNHTRTMLLYGLDDDEALTRVAGPRLEQLVKESQSSYLNSTKPRVKPVGENPLRVLLKAGDPFDVGTGEIPWDDFLLGSLVGRRDPITPISATVLAELEVGERHHERVACYLVLPQRLVSRLDFQPDAAVTIVPFSDGGSAPVDLVWRVDIAGPMPRGAIHLWNERRPVGYRTSGARTAFRRHRRLADGRWRRPTSAATRTDLARRPSATSGAAPRAAQRGASGPTLAADSGRGGTGLGAAAGALQASHHRRRQPGRSGGRRGCDRDRTHRDFRGDVASRRRGNVPGAFRNRSPGVAVRLRVGGLAPSATVRAAGACGLLRC